MKRIPLKPTLYLLVLLVVFVGCRDTATKKVGLYVLVSSDAGDGAIDNIRVQVLHKTQGELWRGERTIKPSGEFWLPSSITASPSSQFPDASFLFRIVGFKEGRARIVTEAISPIPADKYGFIRLDLSLLCLDQVRVLERGEIVGLCADGQTCINGVCRAIPDYSGVLPDYDPNANDGTRYSSSTCFNAQGCFATSQIVLPDDACQILPPAVEVGQGLSLGVLAYQTADGIAFRGSRLIVLDSDGSGQTTEDSNGKLTLNQGLCDYMRQNPTAQLLAARNCQAKVRSVPICREGMPADATSGNSDTAVDGPTDDSALSSDGLVSPDASKAESGGRDVGPENDVGSGDVRGEAGTAADTAIWDAVPFDGALDIATDSVPDGANDVETSGNFCPTGMTWIPGGAYTIDAGRAVTVSSFCMDTTEVTVAAYQACVNAGACAEPRSAGMLYCNWAVQGRDNHPINCVDWNQIATYCDWRGGRLPTEEEWEWAARGGGNGSTYPWGDTSPDDQLCWSFDVKQRTGQPRFSSCPVGSHPSGSNPWGIQDLAGNVWEWTSTAWNSTSTDRVRHGGGWYEVDAQWVRADARANADPSFIDVNLGGRCVHTP